MTFEISEFKVELDERAVLEVAGGPDIERALVILGQVGEAEAKENAPVDTGHLRRSITHQMQNSGTPDQFMRVGTNVEYAVFQEFGTKFHAAHPFFRPAMSAVEQRVRRGSL